MSEALTVFCTIEGIGDKTVGLWKFSSSVPSYGGSEFKPWLTEWPGLRSDRVDELGGYAESGEITVKLNDGDPMNSGALTDLFRIYARPATSLKEDVSSSDTAFQVYKSTLLTPFVGDLMWIGMEVMLRGTDSGADLTVTRAQLGTTAIPHKKGTPVYSYPHYIAGRILRLYVVDSGAASSASEELIGEYVIDLAEPENGMSVWSLSGRSRLASLHRRIGSGFSSDVEVKEISSSGVMTFSGTGAEHDQGNPFTGHLSAWSDGGFLLVADELIEAGTAEQPNGVSVLQRGSTGTDVLENPSGSRAKPVLVSSLNGPGSFRYSSTNSTTRASGFSSTANWVDILLCLLTSSADADDGLELTNGDATYGNWSSLPVGWGLGIDISQIDLESFASVKARTLNWEFLGLRVDRDAGPFGEWAAKHILQVVGAYLVSYKGTLYLRMSRPPLPLDTVTALDESSLLAPPSAVLDSSRMTAEVRYSMRGPSGQEVTELYRASDLLSVHTERGRYEAELSAIELDASGVQAGESGAPSWLRFAGQRRLLRGSQPRWAVGVEVNFSDRGLLPGSKVTVTCPHLPDLVSGTLGWTAVASEVLSEETFLGDRASVVRHSLVTYNGFDRTRNIAPSAVISSVSTNTATMQANEFSQSDAVGGLPQADAAGFEAGMIVELRDPDGTETVAGTQEVVSVSSNDVELDGNFGGSLASGKILVLAQEDSARTADKTNYAHTGSLTDGDILSGTALREYAEI